MQRQGSGQQRKLFKIIVGLLVGLVLLWFTGCTLRGDGVPRRLEADYGHSVISSRLEMTITPPDAVDPTPPVGMAPAAAINSQNRYDKTFAPKENRTRPLLVAPGSSQ